MKKKEAAKIVSLVSQFFPNYPILIYLIFYFSLLLFTTFWSRRNYYYYKSFQLWVCTSFTAPLLFLFYLTLQCDLLFQRFSVPLTHLAMMNCHINNPSLTFPWWTVALIIRLSPLPDELRINNLSLTFPWWTVALIIHLSPFPDELSHFLSVSHLSLPLSKTSPRMFLTERNIVFQNFSPLQ
jgi:hypothetical protein